MGTVLGKSTSFYIVRRKEQAVNCLRKLVRSFASCALRAPGQHRHACRAGPPDPLCYQGGVVPPDGGVLSEEGDSFGPRTMKSSSSWSRSSIGLMIASR